MLSSCYLSFTFFLPFPTNHFFSGPFFFYSHQIRYSVTKVDGLAIRWRIEKKEREEKKKDDKRGKTKTNQESSCLGVELLVSDPVASERRASFPGGHSIGLLLFWI